MVYFCIYYTPYIRIYAIGNLIILRENETITGLWGFGVSNSRAFPDTAEDLFTKAEEDAKNRYQTYKKLSEESEAIF
jgi:hypothetical protein